MTRVETFGDEGDVVKEALLIDKDKKPKWAHASVSDVKPEEVEWIFDRPDTLNLDIAKYE